MARSSKAIRKWIICGSLCLPVVAVIALGSHQKSTKQLQYVPAKLESDVPAFVRSIRPVYPYSVIPGGVYGPRELQNWIANDTVVAAHYAGFNIAHAVLLRTTASMLRYVSYRKGDQVLWTRTPLRIPKGELLISDGPRFARARCGNRLSSTPVRPARNDTPDVDLSIPDIEAPRSKTPLTPLKPVIPLSHPAPEDVLPPFELEPEPTYVKQDLPTPLPPVPGSLVPGMATPPISPALPVPAPSKPPMVAPVPEPSPQLQVTLTLGIALVLVSFGRARRKPE